MLNKLFCSVLEDETAPKDRDLYIRSVRFSPDGKLLATGAEDSKIRVRTLLFSLSPPVLYPPITRQAYH